MKKYIIPIAVVVVFAFYLIFANQNSGPIAEVPTPTPTTTGTGDTGGSSPTPTPTPTPSPTPTPTPTPTPPPQSKYKDGTYTGDVANALYGDLQVQITISGGNITSVDTPIYPSSPGETRLVNSVAIPKLKQETIAAQSANVDIVSGATQTSEAFQESLGVALAAAQR